MIPIPTTLFFDRLYIPLFLENLGVLGHIFWRGERVKVTHVCISIEHRDEWCGDLTESGERKRREEGEGLDIGESCNSVFGMGNESETGG